jgi:uncharacterized protein YbaP (TraB family)
MILAGLAAFGTLHVAHASLYPFAREIDEAFASSQVLAVEADNEGSTRKS